MEKITDKGLQVDIIYLYRKYVVKNLLFFFKLANVEADNFCLQKMSLYAAKGLILFYFYF